MRPITPLDIAFVCRFNLQFSGRTIYRQGLGGTQTALIYLARELAALGHRVQVFCHCGAEAGEIDGVRYRPVEELVGAARAEAIDVMVSVADEQIFQIGIPAGRAVWWSHNDYSPLWNGDYLDLTEEMAATLATRADRLITTSRWQTDRLRELLRIPEEHFWQTRNGVHWPYFAGETPARQERRLIYTSVPDRGLDVLLACFPRLRVLFPELELHVFSGFDLWGKSPDWCHAMREVVIGSHRGQPGVVFHETVPQAELARELLASTLWLYPSHAAPATHFYAETSCIAAIEAQAAGLPAVAGARGALPETIADGETGLLIPGDAYAEGYQEAFVAVVAGLLEDGLRRQAMGQAARARVQAHYTWQVIAREWSDFLADLVASPATTRLVESLIPRRFPAPRASVIIPTYNRARNLRNTLGALAAQTSREFEVLVCDDGSTDDTRDLVESFRGRLNIRYLRQEHRGFRAGEARNMGAAAARGRVLIFLDSDVIVGPAFVAGHLRRHQPRHRIVVNSFVYRMTADHPELDVAAPDHASFATRFGEALAPDSRERFRLFEPGTEWEHGYFLDSNALSLRAEAFAEVGGFDTGMVGWGHEDTELGLRLAEAGYKFHFLKDETTGYHQYHPLSPTKEEERAENWRRLVRKHGITDWYLPLSSLTVAGPVRIEERNPPDLAEVPPERFWEAYARATAWDAAGRRPLEVGQPLSSLNVAAVVVLEDGVVVEIRLP